jgi:vanillate O-demethylase monooxygenase subunit
MTAANYPRNCWYVAATSDEVGRTPLGRVLLDRPVVLYRALDGTAVALADRCAHRGYPLSSGRLQDDALVCGYHGMRYDVMGQCVLAPSQANVPYNACVATYPVQERGPYVWIWLGDPRLSALSPIPDLPWVTAPGWAFSGTEVKVAANFMLLHEHYLDLTHIPEVHPVETPEGMEQMPGFDEVVISETSASYERQLPRAPLADWEAEWAGLPRDREYDRRHQSTFISPAVLVDWWEIATDGPTKPTVARVQAITPETPTSTHMFWQLARNHETAREVVGQHLRDVMEAVMRIDVTVVERIEATVGYEGSQAGIRLAADAGVLRVRRIVAGMLAAESGQRSRFRASAPVTSQPL